MHKPRAAKPGDDGVDPDGSVVMPATPEMHALTSRLIDAIAETRASGAPSVALDASLISTTLHYLLNGHSPEQGRADLEKFCHALWHSGQYTLQARGGGSTDGVVMAPAPDTDDAPEPERPDDAHVAQMRALAMAITVQIVAAQKAGADEASVAAALSMATLGFLLHDVSEEAAPGIVRAYMGAFVLMAQRMTQGRPSEARATVQ